MCILLLVTGVLTAKYNSETTVFGTEHPVVQVFKAQDRTLINVSGRIFDYEPEKVKKYALAAWRIVLSPVGNITEAISSIRGE